MKESDLEMYEWIDRFLENDLSSDEQKEFENRLLTDSDFQEEFDKQKELFDAMNEHASLLSIKEDVEEVESKVFSEIDYQSANEIKTFSALTLLVAMSSVAAVVFVVTFFGINYFNKSGVSNSKVAYHELSGEVKALQERQESLWKLFSNDKKSGLDYKYGTAIFIQDSLYLTNKHLIKNATKINVNGWRGKVFSVDSLSDLALVKIVDSTFVRPKRYYGFINAEKRLATSVFTLGFPKEDVVYKPGVISSLNGNKGDTTQLEVDISLNEGNSGSPIIDSEGCLIGVVTGKNKKQNGAGYAIKQEVIRSFMNKNNLMIKKKSSVRNKPRTSQVEAISKNVARVVVF